MATKTQSQSWGNGKSKDAAPLPGCLVVFSGASAQLGVLPLGAAPITLGRQAAGPVALDDACMSRRHAEVLAVGDRALVRDLDSRNGTFVDGVRITGEARLNPGQVLRVGDTLLVVVPNVHLYAHTSVEISERGVVGPQLLRVWEAIARVAKDGNFIHIRGETGSGKELAARHFHQQSRHAAGPFVAVNCASIPPPLAERLLFGARRGAYSGADADAEGYLQAADGGTLFLDEIGELGAEVQAKLLRTIERHEVMPLGATRARAVDLQLCSATHDDLRDEVGRGRFREDLYYRIGRPSVLLPPLRERREDIPWLLNTCVGKEKKPLGLHASFVEAALLRHWPGNIRELINETVSAVAAARAAGSPDVRAQHLDPGAGQRIESGATTSAAVAAQTPETILRAIDEAGSVTAAARKLGLHRNQLRRLMTKYQLDVGDSPAGKGRR